MSTDTTEAGLPYPLGDDPVRLGAQRIKELAQAAGHTMFAVLGAGAYSLPNASFDAIGPTAPWTAIGPASPPSQFTYAVGSANTLQANVSGLFRITASVHFDTNPTGHRWLRVLKNSAVLRRTGDAAITGTVTQVEITVTAYLAAGDTLGVQAYQNSGAPLALVTGNGSRGIVMEYLGTAATDTLAALTASGEQLADPHDEEAR